MINSNEIRIGNWVTKHTGGVIDSHKWETIQVTIENIGSYDFYEPIPLTPEILEQCGFKYTKYDGLSSFDETRHDPDDFTHEWSISVGRNNIVLSSFELSLIKWGSDKEFTLSNNKLRLRVRYLHQLQNLIFVLTGAELPITLK